MSGPSSSGHPFYVISTGPKPQIYKKTFAGLAISQVTMGIFMVILQAAIIPMSVISSYNLDGVAAPGVWLGVAIVITGGIGIGAARRSSRKWITAYMILNIITVSLFVSSFIIAVSIFTMYDFNSYHYTDYNYPDMSTSVGALNIVNLIMAGAQFFITITAAVFGCKHLCCQITNPYQPFVIPAYPSGEQPSGAITMQAVPQPANQSFPQPAGQGFQQLAAPVYIYNAATTHPVAISGLMPPNAPLVGNVSSMQVASYPPPYSGLQKTN